MDLPTIKVQKLDLNVAPNSNHEFAGNISGPYGRKFLFSTNEDRCLLFNLTRDGRCALVQSFTGFKGSLSPDAKSIAFLESTGDSNSGLFRVFVRSVDTGQTKVLADQAVAAAPIWSPDSKGVAVAIDTPPEHVPWGDTDGLNRNSSQSVETLFPIVGGKSKPLAVGSGAAWMNETDLIVSNDDLRFTCDTSGQNPVETKDYYGVFAFPDGRLILTDQEATTFDDGVPTVGAGPGPDEGFANIPRSIRCGTVTGELQIPLVIIKGADNAWDEPNRYAVSFTTERL